MKLSIKGGVIAAVAAAAVAVPLAGAASASAATVPGVVTANTHSNNHPDTTSLPPQDLPGATLSSGGGPVWAWDNTEVKITATPYTTPQSDGANWSVVLTEKGQFQGFADPTNGSALTSTGNLTGVIQYDVQSGNQPDAKNLPSTEPGVPTRDQAGIDAGQNTHLSDMINQLFGGSSTVSAETVVGWGPYTFAYQNSPGNPGYVQNQPAVGPYQATGDVTGH
jgi:hypothetical protein